MVTFVVYSLLGLASLGATFWFSFNKKSLIKPLIVFSATYLCVYVIAKYLELNTSLFDFVKGVAFTFVVFSIVALLKAIILPSKIRKYLSLRKTAFILVVFLALFLPLILICYLIATGSLISSDIILALAQTNAQEGTEFFLSNVNYRWLIAFLAIFVLVFINYKSFEKVDFNFRKYRLFVSSFGVILFYSIFFALPRMDYLPYAVVNVTSRQLNEFKLYKVQKEERLAKITNLPTLSKSKKLDPYGNLFVLVIGESQSSNRMQSYGYQRANTPFIMDRLKTKNTIQLNHAFSSWPQTVQALNLALTNSNQYHMLSPTDSYSIIEIARAAKFKTYWLSNQRKYGIYETPVTVMSSTANQEIWTNGSAKMEGVFFDGEILKRFPTIDQRENVLIVIHLMGSHQKYNRRVPSKFKVFNGTDKVEDSYDNTILYADYILDQIYKKVSELMNFKALVYFSDHGEEPKVVGGHDPVNLTYQMIKVPVYVYLSDKYIKDNPAIYENLNENKDKYFTNDLIFEMLSSIMGISGIPNYQAKYDITSARYQLDKDSAMTMYGEKHINEFFEEKTEINSCK